MIFFKEMVKNVLALLWSRRAYKFFIRDWISLGDLNRCRDVLSTMRFSRNLQPITMEVPPGRRLLAFAPHPDDETLGAGGTLIKAIRKGAEVRTVYMTSGRPSLEKKMEEEAQQVSKFVGYDTEFLRYPLNEIPIEMNAKEKVAACINQFQPDVLFVPFLLDDHDDHRRVSHLLYLIYKEDLLKRPFAVWAYQVYSTVFPNIIVDITEVVEDKAKAVDLWSSQKRTRDLTHYILGMNAFNSRFLRQAGKRYVETFFAVPSEEYFSLCSLYFAEGGRGAYYHPNYLNE